MNHLPKLYESLKRVHVSVNNDLCGKLVSSFQIKFDERFKVTSALFFILDFRLLS